MCLISRSLTRIQFIRYRFSYRINKQRLLNKQRLHNKQHNCVIKG